MMTEYPPTDRYILWVISKAPYAFNIAYWGQFVQENPSMSNPDSKFGKAVETVRTLGIRGFVKQKQNLNWKITLKGKLFRFTTHPQFALFPIAVAIILAITAMVVNHKSSPIGPVTKTTVTTVHQDTIVRKKAK